MSAGCSRRTTRHVPPGARRRTHGEPTARHRSSSAARARLTPRDVSLLGVTDPVELVDPLLGRAALTAEGLTDRVIWNPGPGHGLSDVPDGAQAGFVCLEAARLTPVTLEPGQTWVGRQLLRSEPVAGPIPIG